MGNPARLVGGPGQQGEVLRAAELIQDLTPGHVLADTAYDAEHFHEAILLVGASAVIKPRPNRKKLRPFDRELYKERNVVERFFNKLKHYRAIATRFEKFAENYLGLIKMAAARIWMRFMSP